jgi:hypothetical protein
MRIEISRRNFHVKRISIGILALTLIALSLFSSSCGTSDKIASVSMQVVGSGAGTVNLIGLGSTLQLQVLTNYTSGKQIDQTNFATYTVVSEGYYCTWSDGVCTNGSADQAAMPSPPSTLTINKTGMVSAVDPAVCSWINVGTTQTPGWAYTGDYMITATFRGFTSNPVFIPMASAASLQPGNDGQCGPTATN